MVQGAISSRVAPEDVPDRVTWNDKNKDTGGVNILRQIWLKIEIHGKIRSENQIMYVKSCTGQITYGLNHCSKESELFS